MAVWSEPTAPGWYAHPSALAFQPALYMGGYWKPNPLPASGDYPPEVCSTAASTHADATHPCIGLRGGANRRITAGPHSQPFRGARQRWLIWVHQGRGALSALPQPKHPHTTRHGGQNTCVSCEAPETNSHVSLGEGCRLEDIYIYIYIYIYIWHMLTNISTRVQGHRGGLGWGVGTPPLFWGRETRIKMFET